jgi:hypothetical protein
MPTQSPAIQCTTVELTFLASLLGADTLATLPESMQQWSAEALDTAWSEVQTQLAGRGLITVQPDGAIRVDESVAALVGTCSFAEATVVATYTGADGDAGAHQFHVIRSAAVEMVVSGEGAGEEALCELTELDDSRAVLRRIAAIFRLDRQQGPAVPNGSLRERALRQARKLARESGQEAAHSWLVLAGLPPETAEALAETLDRPVGNGALVVLSHEGRQLQSDGLGLLEGENGLWLLRTVDRDGSKWVDVVPCSATTMGDFIRAVMARALGGAVL